MKKKVVINIVDSHFDAKDKYSSELNALGTLEHTEDGYLLSYEEPCEGLEGCVTTLRCESNGTVTMTRCGDYSTQMIMEREKRHSCHYNTPMGEMVMGVFARRIESDMTEDGGSLLLDYTIDINADFASINELKITVSAV